MSARQVDLQLEITIYFNRRPNYAGPTLTCYSHTTHAINQLRSEDLHTRLEVSRNISGRVLGPQSYGDHILRIPVASLTESKV